jgi:chloramphenicol O-acetyltransferase
MKKKAWNLRTGDKIKYQNKIITLSTSRVYYEYGDGNLIYWDNKNKVHTIACNGQDLFEVVE